MNVIINATPLADDEFIHQCFAEWQDEDNKISYPPPLGSDLSVTPPWAQSRLKVAKKLSLV